jgi:hypothetical protein
MLKAARARNTTTRTIRRSAVAAGCAVAVSALLGACGSSTSSTTAPGNGSSTLHGTAPIPSTSTGSAGTTSADDSTTGTSTANMSGTTSTAPTQPGSGEFLKQSELPDYPTYGWTKPQLNHVNVEHPLPDTCGNALGPQVTNGVLEADFGARDPNVTAVEDVYTYASASDARAQLTAAAPKCAGTTAGAANGFAWRGANPGGLAHVLIVVKGDKLAALAITPGSRDYSASIDARLLAEMTQQLG